MKIIDIKNQKYNNVGSIDCEVLVESYKNYLPFTASPNDVDENGRKIYAALLAGKYGKILAYEENE